MSQRDGSREIWVHALGAKAGGGVTYLRAVVPELAHQVGLLGYRLVVLAHAPMSGLPPNVEVQILERWAANALHRLVYDQIVLPLLLRRRRPAGVFFTGNFCSLIRGPHAVVLLRNTIYFDRDFIVRRPRIARVALAAQRYLILAGASRAEAVVYPSFTMRALVETRAPWLNGKGWVSGYGVHQAFYDLRRNDRGTPSSEPATFLIVASFSVQKNITVVLQALAKARAEMLPVRVVVTATLEEGSPGALSVDCEIVRRHELVESGYLVLLGPRYGADLRKVYLAAHACVMPSFTESFGHPMVEAMAAGKPLLCADRPYAREVCGIHAQYFDPDDPEALVAIWRAWPRETHPAPPASVWLRRRFSWPRHCHDVMRALGVTS